MVLTASAKTAERMGQRAGQHFRDLGIPTPNPFSAAQPDLAQAWRVAYFANAGKR